MWQKKHKWWFVRDVVEECGGGLIFMVALFSWIFSQDAKMRLLLVAGDRKLLIAIGCFTFLMVAYTLATNALIFSALKDKAKTAEEWETAYKRDYGDRWVWLVVIIFSLMIGLPSVVHLCNIP